jgi:hypothetical protein
MKAADGAPNSTVGATSGADVPNTYTSGSTNAERALKLEDRGRQASAVEDDRDMTRPAAPRPMPHRDVHPH